MGDCSLGLFNFFSSYNKPGPGVEKDEPPKSAPIRFFEIYFRKFGKLLQANLIFVLPTIAVALLMGILYFLVPHLLFKLSPNTEAIDLTINYLVPLPLILLFPFMAGLTLITRNFSREEHAFIWSDFWDAVKANWKYFLINGFIVYIVYFLMSFSMRYYFGRAAEEAIFYVPFAFCAILTLIFLIAQYYIPVMFITFDLKFGQVYKNALIFVLAGFGRNLIVTAVLIVLALLIPFPTSPISMTIFLILTLFWLFSFVSYLVNFAVYPVIDRYMIQPYQRKVRAEEKKSSTEKLSVPFTAASLPKQESEYVYRNGRLIKRSELTEDEEDTEEDI